MSSHLFRRLRSRHVERLAASSAFVAVELLEDLQLLSAASPLNARGSAAGNRLFCRSGDTIGEPSDAPRHKRLPDRTHPRQIAQAYGFNQVSFDNGAIKGDGAGQTIAIVDASYDPNIASDLQKFDAQFGLSAPPSFSQFVEQGATTNSGWALETALDVEWAHAMAPGANIDLIEAKNSSLGSLMAAVNYARNLANVSVVSMSWGGSEFASRDAVRQSVHHARRPHGHHVRRVLWRCRGGNDLAFRFAECAGCRRHFARCQCKRLLHRRNGLERQRWRAQHLRVGARLSDIGPNHGPANDSRRRLQRRSRKRLRRF